MTEPFVVEGDLLLGEQEGGFAYPCWEVDGKHLEELIIEHFGVKQNGRNSEQPWDWPVGRVRITIEQLEATA